MTDEALFREEQRFRQWWFLLLVAGTALIGWTAWLQQIVVGEPFGTNPAPDGVVWAVWVITGLLVPAVALWLKLVTLVVPGAVVVRFPPFRPRRVTTEEILDVRPVEVRPLAGWGGYGYRRRPDGNVAFLVRGRDAVQLSLGGERRLVIGSRHPEQLATAITAAQAPG